MGVEYFDGIMDGSIDAPNMWKTMPCRLIDHGVGFIKVWARAADAHKNGIGLVHGGFAATILDTVAACAINTTAPTGIGFATVDLNVKLLKPIPLAVDLFAEGRVIKASRSIGVAEGTIRDEDGEIYAHATTTCIGRPVTK